LNLSTADLRNYWTEFHETLWSYRYMFLVGPSGNVEFLPPIFYTVFWQPFWKWQTSRKFWKHRIASLMVTYHYVKFYVSIIIHLEVTAQIQHCPISTPFHTWVDYDAPKWFLTSKNFYRSPFSKWPPHYRTNSTLSDFKDIS
jgi:hypothetical protein